RLQLAEIEQISPEALEWLLSHVHPQYCAELYFPGRRYGHTTSNIVESLNAVILEAELALRIFESISNRAGGLLGSIRVRNYRSRAEQTSCSIRGRGHVEHGICVQARFESNSNRTGVG